MPYLIGGLVAVVAIVVLIIVLSGSSTARPSGSTGHPGQQLRKLVLVPAGSNRNALGAGDVIRQKGGGLLLLLQAHGLAANSRRRFVRGVAVQRSRRCPSARLRLAGCRRSRNVLLGRHLARRRVPVPRADRHARAKLSADHARPRRAACAAVAPLVALCRTVAKGSLAQSMSRRPVPPSTEATTPPRRRYAPRMPPAQRREQLIDAALSVILEQGYGGVSIEAVARTAGVTRPVVYDHFPNLGRLLHALVEREERYALEQLQQVVPDDPGDLEPAELLVGGVRRFLEAVASRPATWRIILLPLEGTPAIVRDHVEKNRARTQERIERLVRWAVGGPELPEDLDVELTARAIRVPRRGGRAHAADRPRALLARALRGLRELGHDARAASRRREELSRPRSSSRDRDHRTLGDLAGASDPRPRADRCAGRGRAHRASRAVRSCDQRDRRRSLCDARADEAAAADQRIAAAAPGAELPPLLGVPCTVKESIAVRGMPLSAGLVARRDYPRHRERLRRPAARRRRRDPARGHEHLGADAVDRVREPGLRSHEQSL